MISFIIIILKLVFFLDINFIKWIAIIIKNGEKNFFSIKKKS